VEADGAWSVMLLGRMLLRGVLLGMMFLRMFLGRVLGVMPVVMVMGSLLQHFGIFASLFNYVSLGISRSRDQDESLLVLP
jgi:hypothetical protein